MKSYSMIFYGDVSPQGYKISYLLITRKLVHDFVLSDNVGLSIEAFRKLRTLDGFDIVHGYLERFLYVVDFPEVTEW